MYAVLKDRGSMANVTLRNEDTGVDLVLGKITIKMLDMLRKEIPDIVSGSMSEPWVYAVSEELAKDLARLTMPMKKPVRTKKTSTVAESEHEAEPATTKSGKAPVDIFDLLYGEDVEI